MRQKLKPQTLKPNFTAITAIKTIKGEFYKLNFLTLVTKRN